MTATAPTYTEQQGVALRVVPTLTRVVTLRLPPNYGPAQGTRPSFGWGAVPGATRYLLEMSTDATFPAPLALVQGGLADTTFQLRGPFELDSTQTYFWRVTATNDCDSSQTSGPFTFGPGGTTGRAEAAPEVALRVAPNASASGEFGLTLSGAPAGPVRAVVVDALGRVVFSASLPAPGGGAATHSVRVPGAAGVYLLRVALADGRVLARRLVK